MARRKTKKIKRMQKAGFVGYLKSAFLFHWNLLAVVGGTVGAFLLGRPDVLLPILGAAELLYLVSLASHPKFQRAVDARIHKRKGAEAVHDANKHLKKMLGPLNRTDRLRFIRLGERSSRPAESSSSVVTSILGLLRRRLFRIYSVS